MRNTFATTRFQLALATSLACMTLPSLAQDAVFKELQLPTIEQPSLHNSKTLLRGLERRPLQASYPHELFFRDPPPLKPGQFDPVLLNYWGHTKEQPHKETLAEGLLAGYAKEEDRFKRKDMLQALEPVLPQFLEAAQKTRNTNWRLIDNSGKGGTQVQLAPFDHDKGSFSITLQPVTDYVLDKNYLVKVATGELPKTIEYRPASEKEARAIEALRAQKINFTAVYYGYFLHSYLDTKTKKRTSLFFVDAIGLATGDKYEPAILLHKDHLSRVVRIIERAKPPAKPARDVSCKTQSCVYGRSLMY